MRSAIMSPAALDAGPPAAALRLATAAFALAVLAHNADHLRRGGDSVSAQVFWLGSLAIVAEVAVVALVVMDHPVAPLAAVVNGFMLALGYVAVHFTPGRSWFSDPLLETGAAGWSRAAAALETAASLALGLAGLAVLRRQGVAAALDGSRPARLTFGQALRRPLLAVMVAGNLAIFLGSLATR